MLQYKMTSSCCYHSKNAVAQVGNKYTVYMSVESNEERAETYRRVELEQWVEGWEIVLSWVRKHLADLAKDSRYTYVYGKRLLLE